jgi:hypothetical protein
MRRRSPRWKGSGESRWRCPVLGDGGREWRTMQDIDTRDGALPYEELTGGEDYVAYFARRAMEAGAGRGGPLGAGTGHVLEARALVAGTVALIEETFSPRRGP